MRPKVMSGDEEMVGGQKIGKLGRRRLWMVPIQIQCFHIILSKLCSTLTQVVFATLANLSATSHPQNMMQNLCCLYIRSGFIVSLLVFLFLTCALQAKQ